MYIRDQMERRSGIFQSPRAEQLSSKRAFFVFLVGEPDSTRKFRFVSSVVPGPSINEDVERQSPVLGRLPEIVVSVQEEAPLWISDTSGFSIL